MRHRRKKIPQSPPNIAMDGSGMAAAALLDSSAADTAGRRETLAKSVIKGVLEKRLIIRGDREILTVSLEKMQ